MPSILSRVLNLLTGSETNQPSEWLKVPKNRPLNKLTERDLIRLESEIGAQLFGPLSTGRRREFFCLDASTWIWYEEWIDQHRQLKSTTTRYEIQEQGILKVQEGSRYSYVEGEELKNILAAINMYYERVMRDLYKIDPDTGQQISQ